MIVLLCFIITFIIIIIFCFSIRSDDPSDDPVRCSDPDFVDAALRCAKIGTRTQNVSIEKSCLTVDLTINCEF